MSRVRQEVQSNHFQEFLMPELQKHGYTAVYKKKTTELYTANKFAIDGCATFFRKDRFALVKKYEARLPAPFVRERADERQFLLLCYSVSIVFSLLS